MFVIPSGYWFTAIVVLIMAFDFGRAYADAPLPPSWQRQASTSRYNVSIMASSLLEIQLISFLLTATVVLRRVVPKMVGKATVITPVLPMAN